MQINKKFLKSLLNLDLPDLIDEINESFYTHTTYCILRFSHTKRSPLRRTPLYILLYVIKRWFS